VSCVILIVGVADVAGICDGWRVLETCVPTLTGITSHGETGCVEIVKDRTLLLCEGGL